MRITTIACVQELHGRIPGSKAKWHARTNKYGTIFLARNGVSTKPPTAKQEEYRERMRKANQLFEQIQTNPDLLAQWQKRFEEQKHYTSLRGMVMGESLKNPKAN